MATINIRNLCKQYGSVEVLEGLDLTVEEGEFVVLLGPSGCGKSTLLRMIAGLEDVSGGTIEIDGEIINEVAPGDRGVAMVFQNYALYPHMSVFDNIAFGLKRQRLPADEIRRRVQEVAALLKIEQLLDRRPRQLSGGQQQRVAMARAMSKTPKVFLFDEPLSNLDAKLRDHLRVEIKRLHAMLGTTTVFVTHDQLEAMALASRIVVMNGGKIEQVGTPSEIFQRPGSEFVARFVGNPAMNILEGTLQDEATVSVAGVPIRVGPGRLSGLAVGSPVRVGVRPRDFKRAGKLPRDEVCGRFSAKVEIVELLGEEAQLELQGLGGNLVMMVDARTPPQTGSALDVEVGVHGIHLFDGRDGQVLPPVSSPPAP